ncbi:MAG: helix-turn-helix transcriptional regulator [Anaerolineales bacterium]|nr:helix-turn-helix transcriptional regulator [Anaerolineales bacterium]MCW5856006.1 helix-turn-helix transcriptional regulator [Anaerolineales bacterium]
MNQLPDLSTWLEEQYLLWQQAQGKRTTLAQFAKYLGISGPLLSHYMNGIRKPSEENMKKLAQHLSADIYDILGLQKPDAKLQFISRNWNRLSVQQQQSLIEGMERYLEKQKGQERKK